MEKFQIPTYQNAERRINEYSFESYGMDMHQSFLTEPVPNQSSFFSVASEDDNIRELRAKYQGLTRNGFIHFANSNRYDELPPMYRINESSEVHRHTHTHESGYCSNTCDNASLMYGMSEDLSMYEGFHNPNSCMHYNGHGNMLNGHPLEVEGTNGSDCSEYSDEEESPLAVEDNEARLLKGGQLQENGFVLLSIGSTNHTTGGCKPCVFFHNKGCKNGFSCQFCHEVHPKRRRIRKVSGAKLEKLLERAAQRPLVEWASKVLRRYGSISTNPVVIQATQLALSSTPIPPVPAPPALTQQGQQYSNSQQHVPQLSMSFNSLATTIQPLRKDPSSMINPPNSAIAPPKFSLSNIESHTLPSTPDTYANYSKVSPSSPLHPGLSHVPAGIASSASTVNNNISSISGAYGSNSIEAKPLSHQLNHQQQFQHVQRSGNSPNYTLSYQANNGSTGYPSHQMQQQSMYHYESPVASSQADHHLKHDIGFDIPSSLPASHQHPVSQHTHSIQHSYDSGPLQLNSGLNVARAVSSGTSVHSGQHRLMQSVSNHRFHSSMHNAGDNAYNVSPISTSPLEGNSFHKPAAAGTISAPSYDSYTYSDSVPVRETRSFTHNLPTSQVYSSIYHQHHQHLNSSNGAALMHSVSSVSAGNGGNNKLDSGALMNGPMNINTNVGSNVARSTSLLSHHSNVGYTISSSPTNINSSNYMNPSYTINHNQYANNGIRDNIEAAIRSSSNLNGGSPINNTISSSLTNVGLTNNPSLEGTFNNIPSLTHDFDASAYDMAIHDVHSLLE